MVSPVGRKRKPAELHVLQGTHRKKDHGPKSAAAIGGGVSKPTKAPNPPDELDRIGKAEWRRVVKLLMEVNLLANADLRHLARYCAAYQDVRRITKELDKWNKDHPKLYNMTHNGTGTLVSHPLVGQRERATKSMLEFGREFGMTPSSRTRLIGMMEAPKAENPFQQFKGKRT